MQCRTLFLSVFFLLLMFSFFFFSFFFFFVFSGYDLFRNAIINWDVYLERISKQLIYEFFLRAFISGFALAMVYRENKKRSREITQCTNIFPENTLRNNWTEMFSKQLLVINIYVSDRLPWYWSIIYLIHTHTHIHTHIYIYIWIYWVKCLTDWKKSSCTSQNVVDYLFIYNSFIYSYLFIHLALCFALSEDLKIMIWEKS